MKRYIKLLLPGCFLLLGSQLVSAQQRQTIDDILHDPSNNYFTIKQKADDFFARVGTVGTGYKEFKRWEFLVRNNVDADGTLPDFPAKNKAALESFRSNPNNLIAGRTAATSPNWVALGQPNPTIQAGDAQNGTGALRCIEFSGPDIWMGTPGGGMWFGNFVSGSTYTWSAKTDGIPNLAIQDVVIAPTNSNIMYAMTGAVGSASGYRSTGVIRSTDGGNTWFTSGLSFPESGNVRGYKMLVSPTTSNTAWAATDNGLFRTTDGGTTWTLVTYSTTVGGAQTNFTAATYDLAYQPGSTTVMYAMSAGPYFYKSTDGGVTFLRVDRATAGLPTTGGRVSIGVTAANSSVIYLLYGDGTNFQALYRSGNSGTSFTLQCDLAGVGNIVGGQAWRNIAIAVSPTNAADVYVGGLDVYKSTTSGVSWTKISDWTASASTSFSHADIFELVCDATYLYCASDGGLYRMTRATDSWLPLHAGTQIAQAYRIGIDPTAAAAFVTMGNQDNGTYKNSGSTYLSIGGGDGMETVVNPSNTNVIYLSSQNGNFYRSDDGGTTNGFIRSGPGNWTTPAVLRPGNSTHIYIGYVNIDYSTTSGTGGWATITTGFGSAIESLEFAPSNNTILYATDGASVKRFNLSGAVWSAGTTINGNLPVLSNITEIAVDPNNSAHVLISVGGYSSTQKVFETFDANVASPTWNSIVRNLPNVPINCITMDDDVNNTIYIGTDIGVFVTNDQRVNWIMFNDNLPTTRVYDLEINYSLSPNRIYAGTFGRGVFYAEVYTGCATSVTLSGVTTGLNYVEASSDITSTQVITGGEGTSVGLNAGGTVTLNPGFSAKDGVKFKAYNNGCTNSGNPPQPLRTAPVIEEKPEKRPNPQGDQ